MKTKHLFSICLTILCSISTLMYGFEVDGIYYQRYDYTQNGPVEVTGCDKSISHLIIPETVIDDNGNTRSVTSINYYAFQENESLISVIIPISITRIEKQAFGFCSNLTSVVWNAKQCRVPNGYDRPFYGCSQITSFTFGDSVEYIPVNLCFDLENLRSITINCDNLISIEESAFHDCCDSVSIIWNVLKYMEETTTPKNPFSEIYEQITSFTFGNKVTKIPSYMCSNMTSLSSVDIGTGVTSIGISAFSACSNLTSITIPNSVTSIEKSAFKGCSNLTSIIIPNGIKSIQKSTFYNCSRLTSITIPNSVTSIGESAFRGCNSLASIIIPNDVKSIGESAFANCTNLTSIIIPDGVKSIQKSTFYNCSRLTSITIPNSVTSIGESALGGCNSLASIIIPNDVKSIGESAFANCTNLTSIIIPDGVAAIENTTFASCTNLESVTIGNHVVSMGENAFYNCTNLTKTNYAGDIASWCTMDFYNEYSNPIYYSHNLYINNVEVKDAIIPNGITSIKFAAFYNCRSLNSISIPNSVTSIEKSAFSGCSNLPSITIPLNITSIGTRVFEGCSSLTSIVWNAKHCEDFSNNFTPFYLELYTDNFISGRIDIRSQITSFIFGNSVEHIPSYLCYGLNNLKAITIPNNVKSIGMSVFEGCCELTSVIVPNNVTSLGRRTFYSCSRLTSAIVGDGIPRINGETFHNCTNLKSVTIGKEVSGIGEDAFTSCSNLTNVDILAIKPPGLGTIDEYDIAFDLNTISRCLFRIPCGCYWNYANADGWEKKENFQESLFVDFSANSFDEQKGTVSITQTPNCNNNATAIVEASPRRGYKFIQWNDGDKNAVRKVKVEQNLELIAYFDTAIVESIALNESELTLVKGETTQLIATITPEEVINKNILWSTSDSTIITVQDGLITAIEAGEATITAATEEEAYTASCKVTVILPNALDDVEIDISTQVCKVFEDGTIYIFRNGEKYSIDGRKVE